MKRIIVRIGPIVIFIWIAIWLAYIARDLIGHKYFNDYKILFLRDITGKKSYTYGDRLFEFLNFCADSLPETTNYNFVGIEEPSLEGRRSIYYLYPHIKKEEAAFLLVFNEPGFKKRGYKLYKMLDAGRFILKRI